MTKKINLNQYQGHNRIYQCIPGTLGISKVFKWNAEQGRYQLPQVGKLYCARRQEQDAFGKRKRMTRYFDTLEEARSWQSKHGSHELNLQPIHASADQPDSKENSPNASFSHVHEDWKRRHYPSLAPTTQVNYDRYWRLYLQKLSNVAMCDFTPRIIDDWLEWMKEISPSIRRATPRRAFRHELKALSTIINHYVEFWDDNTFRSPLKKRHRQNAVVCKSDAEVCKDFSRAEFFIFRQALVSAGALGITYAALATVQYFQALRISEAVAIFWEDLSIDLRESKNSRLTIKRHARYMRQSGRPDHIAPGFKNSSAKTPIKEQPLSIEAFEALRSIEPRGVRGLVFRNSKGGLLKYQSIQNAYNVAFQKAGLPYCGTHVLRHGGARDLYNADGDLAMVQQLLGNSDYKTTLVYAQREKQALTKHFHKAWDLHQAGRKWSQTENDLRESIAAVE